MSEASVDMGMLIALSLSFGYIMNVMNMAQHFFNISYPLLLEISFAEISNGVLPFFVYYIMKWSVNYMSLLLIQTSKLIILVYFLSYQTTFKKK